MKLLAVLALAVAAWGQGQAVNQVGDPPPTAAVKLFFYDGSNNLQYICWARGNQQRSTSVTYTNFVVSGGTATATATAHKLYPGASVTLTGSATTALNGTYDVLTTADANTFTFKTSAANATYSDATLVTTSALTSQAKWAIQVLVYNVSNYLTSSYFGASAAGYGLICDNRANY